MVVVVHGLWMTGALFALQRAQLARRGYRAIAFSYPSLRLSLDDLAARLAHFLQLLDVARIHIVGHSLGGLVALHLLGRQPGLPVGRVVLLGSPCAGSLAAAHMARSSAGRAMVGKALLEWQPEFGVAAAEHFEIGSIGGTLRLGVARLLMRLPQPNDGAVCLEETRLSGLRDHLAMPVSHSGMIFSSKVTRQICSFLEHGHFIHA